MLSLTRLFLHHWHRFYAATLDIDGGLCLTGPDEADSAAVLDALQLALFGDPARARFQASRYGFTYDLDAYARGRLTEDKWQRPGNTVSYVAVEFANTASGAKSTAGLCIETGPRLAPEITWFTLAEGLNPATFVTKGRPLPRIELKPLLRNWRGARFYDKALDYQTDVLALLGGLDDAFLDLFQRALHYQPVRRVEDFTSAWFFDEQSVDLSLLRRMRDRLAQLHTDLERAEKQAGALQPIVKGQAELARLGQLRDGQSLLVALLRAQAEGRRAAGLETRIADLQAQLAGRQTRLTEHAAAAAELDRQLRDAERVEFEHGLAHRKTILQWQGRYAGLAADAARQRWTALQKQFQLEAGFLRKVEGLTETEAAARKELLLVVDASTASDRAPQGEPPPPALGAVLNTVIPILLSARDRQSAERARLADRLAGTEAQLARQTGQLQALNQNPQPSPVPDYVGHMQDLLAPVIGKKPPLVYEFIEVTDPRWQNAVEALLGPARFHAIVSATWFNAARANINKQRAALNLKDADVHDPTQHYNRPAQPGSLAEKVTTIYPDLKAYLDTLLGDVLCIETLDEARNYPRAITPDCVYYSGRHPHAFDYFDYQPVVLGKTAYRVFTETRQKQIVVVQSQIASLNSAVAAQRLALSALDVNLIHLSHAYNLTVLRDSLSTALDERPARAEAAGYEAELRGLDGSPLAELQANAAGLRAALARQGQAGDDLQRQAVALEHALDASQTGLEEARAALAEARAGADSARRQFAAVAAAADEALPPHLKPDDLGGEIKAVEQKEKDYDKKVRDERLRLVEALAALNSVYQLAPWPGDPADGRYAEALNHLTAADLPRLQRDIATAEQEIEEELRDHVLRPLRDRLVAALRILDQVNDTLAELESPYRLQADPAPDLKDYYAVILNSAAPAPALAGFYDLLTAQADPRLGDYRRYLQLALAARNAEGQLVRFATADGDAQLAYYLVIAASFAQVYRLRKYGDAAAGRPCVRLLPFGAAFSRMEARLITPVLDLYRRLGFQLAAAVSLERSDYLIAGLPTTIVLTPVKDSLLPEPYRNYNTLPT